MNEELLEELLKTMMTGQIDKEANEASLQLVTIVQKVHTSATYIPLPYTLLPPPLDSVFLTQEQEQKVLERIIGTAQENLDNPATVSLLWIAGKAHSENALPLLSIFLLENYRELANDILFQALISDGYPIK